ncbi:uncharacterized protein LOC123269869 [Cotesia glomerata]|uniref:BV9 family protein n=1 Tax=Cotesia glomerata TaxID=32391 RepID=A0AAV7I8S2_COTGL|nr:uncharacterized protein LOC123269869 [Cotesia glomerata]KAH0547118.1 hypothetical protein KQX54_017161 [Cotesia glomerata]
MTPKIFSIVKLSGVLEPVRNSYVIVPTSWVNSKDDGSVTVPYPSADQLEMEFVRIITCQPALAEWNEYQGVVEREADTYQAGMLYVKHRDSTPLDEELLMLWTRICLEYVDELGRFHPAAIICKIWSRFWK